MLRKAFNALGIGRTTPEQLMPPPPALSDDRDAIDSSNCFTGRNTLAERTLADICRHQDMRYPLSVRQDWLAQEDITAAVKRLAKPAYGKYLESALKFKPST